jgi:hypothetical protein
VVRLRFADTDAVVCAAGVCVLSLCLHAAARCYGDSSSCSSDSSSSSSSSSRASASARRWSLTMTMMMMTAAAAAAAVMLMRHQHQRRRRTTGAMWATWATWAVAVALSRMVQLQQVRTSWMTCFELRRRLGCQQRGVE